MAARKVTDIEGLGVTAQRKLAKVKITRTDHLLREAGSRQGRKALAEATKLSEAKLLEWVNRADLMRVKRVGPQYADLLERAGVDTVKELARRNPGNLHTALVRVRAKTSGTTAAIPGRHVVAEWIEAAKELRPVVTH